MASCLLHSAIGLSLAPSVSSPAAKRYQRRVHTTSSGGRNQNTRFRIVSQAKDEPSSTSLELAAGIGGLFSFPIVAWSLYTLKTTGCGLPPGPGGSLGAIEGVSYLAILGLVGWSASTKLRTGSGLPSGPYGLLSAAEGLAYLTVLASIVVFGFQLVDYGYIPPPIPGEQCFGE